MRLALRHAALAAEGGEVPVGAVLVAENGTVVAAGRNQVEHRCDPTAHAEIMAVREGCRDHGGIIEGPNARGASVRLIRASLPSVRLSVLTLTVRLIIFSRICLTAQKESPHAVVLLAFRLSASI